MKNNHAFPNIHFSSETSKILTESKAVAMILADPEAGCLHILFTLLVRKPDVIHALLGRELTQLPERFRPVPSCFYKQKVPKSFSLSSEFTNLLDTTETAAPIHTLLKLAFNDEITPLELGFLLLQAPTAEISDLLQHNNIPNDLNALQARIKENYQNRIFEFSHPQNRAHRKTTVVKGEKFQKIMNRAIYGQEQAIKNLTDQLISFWYNGNKGFPLRILLLSKKGAGSNFFSNTLQQSFVELELQMKKEPAIDMENFLSAEYAECILLGSPPSYKQAQSGILHSIIQNNSHGVLIFKNIQCGANGATNILSTLATNSATDKYLNEPLKLPFNVLIFTMEITEDQYRFFMSESPEGNITSKCLKEVLFPNEKNRENNSSHPNFTAAACVKLCSHMDKIIFLKDLDENTLISLAKQETEKFQKKLKEEHHITFACENLPRLLQLFSLSSPNKLGPGEMLKILHMNLTEGLWHIIFRNPNLKKLEISCDPLPVYSFDPSRRFIRGDYLTFTKTTHLQQKTLSISFENIRYTTQGRYDCGDYRIERPQHNFSFENIFGLDQVRDELLESLDYISNRENYPVALPPPPLNFILYGPPGTGKTSLAIALANKADIPVFFASSSLFSSAGKIADMFRKANEMAPAIVVLEEINSLGDSSLPYQRDAINELLSILSGVQEAGKLLVLASTNHLEQLEEALLRPGRFGRQIFIGLPNRETKESYIRNFEHKFQVALEDQERNQFLESIGNTSISHLKSVLESALRTSIRTHHTFNFQQLNMAMQKFIPNNSRTPIGFH